MLDDVMSGSRVIEIVQPAGADEESPAGKTVDLRRVGCAGRVTTYQELDDGRLMITLTDSPASISPTRLRSPSRTASWE